MMRYARYAAAVVFALQAIAWLALWARSYQSDDMIMGPCGAGRFVAVGSYWGIVAWECNVLDTPIAWTVSSQPSPMVPDDNRWERGILSGLGFRIKRIGPGDNIYSVPHWFLAASSAALAALFAFKRTWRYSLRTILVATTLLAAVLGLAVYAL